MQNIISMQRAFPSIKVVVLIVTTIFLMSCAVKYPIISVNKMNDIMKKGYISQTPYIVVENTIESSDSSARDEIMNTISLIHKKEREEAESYINSLTETDRNVTLFCKGILNFFNDNYALAYDQLSQTDIQDYNYLKHLLIGDCMQEINLKTKDSFKLKEILFQYQKSMDACSSKDIDQIIKIHIKYAKYGA